jgi:hypothetical protein
VKRKKVAGIKRGFSFDIFGQMCRILVAINDASGTGHGHAIILGVGRFSMTLHF